MAEANSQGLLWPDALCTPALRTGFGIGVGNAPGPPHLNVCRRRWCAGPRGRGLRREPEGPTRGGRPVARCQFEFPKAASWAVGGRPGSPPDDVRARSANPVGHTVPLIGPKNMVVRARKGDGESYRGQDAVTEDGQINLRPVLPWWLDGTRSVGSHRKNLDRPQKFLQGDIWRHRGLRETGRTRAGTKESPRVAVIDGSVARSASPEGKSV